MVVVVVVLRDDGVKQSDDGVQYSDDDGNDQRTRLSRNYETSKGLLYVLMTLFQETDYGLREGRSVALWLMSCLVVYLDWTGRGFCLTAEATELH